MPYVHIVMMMNNCLCFFFTFIKGRENKKTNKKVHTLYIHQQKQTKNYFKKAKIPPTINPTITRRIILLPENTESVYLLQNLSISNK